MKLVAAVVLLMAFGLASALDDAWHNRYSFRSVADYAMQCNPWKPRFVFGSLEDYYYLSRCGFEHDCKFYNTTKMIETDDIVAALPLRKWPSAPRFAFGEVVPDSVTESGLEFYRNRNQTSMRFGEINFITKSSIRIPDTFTSEAEIIRAMWHADNGEPYCRTPAYPPPEPSTDGPTEIDYNITFTYHYRPRRSEDPRDTDPLRRGSFGLYDYTTRFENPGFQSAFRPRATNETAEETPEESD